MLVRGLRLSCSFPEPLMARAMCILLTISIPQLLLGAARSTGLMTSAISAAVSGAISAVVEVVCGVGHQTARDEATLLLSDEKCDDTPLAAGPRPVMVRRVWKLGAAASALLLLLLALTATPPPPPPPPARATGVRLKAWNTKSKQCSSRPLTSWDERFGWQLARALPCGY